MKTRRSWGSIRASYRLAGGIGYGAGQSYALTARLAGGLEAYEYKTTEGVVETRTEEPEWRWYTDLGAFGQGELTLTEEPADFDEIEWIAPEEPGTGVVHAVVLDGRGGMGWWSVGVEVR